MNHFAADVLGIAKSMGAKVVLYDFEGKLDGVIVRIGGRPYVGIDRALGIVDARFTIAHELAHLEDGTVSSAYTLIAERRADRIAREKLIPEPALRKAMEDHGADYSMLSPLFWVPERVMENRIKDVFYL